MPFAVLAAFFARAVTLPGAGAGIRTLFSPDFAAIWSPSIWVAAHELRSAAPSTASLHTRCMRPCRSPPSRSSSSASRPASAHSPPTRAAYTHTVQSVHTIHTIQAHSPPTRASRLQARPSAARPSSSLSPTRPSPSSPASPSLAFSASSHTPPAQLLRRRLCTPPSASRDAHVDTLRLGEPLESLVQSGPALAFQVLRHLRDTSETPPTHFRHTSETLPTPCPPSRFSRSRWG